ncbi:MAG: hypothetical protein JNK79_18605 [Chitinophagaceae bacterium]|nr:hypothetical protein [Chitinophagaceae bacterium]
MIAYSHTSLDNMVIHEQSAKARSRQLIDSNEFNNIKTAHPINLYTPNLFIRIGLFLATSLIILMSQGLLMLMFGGLADSDTGIAIVVAVFGIGVYWVLEYFIREKKHYRSGVDDALMWASVSLLAGDLIFYFNMSSLQASVTVLIFSLFASIRFGNSVMAGVAFLSFLCVLFFSITPFGAIAKTILPFVTMIVSLAVYLFARSKRNDNRWRHYRYCIMMLEFLSLVSTYLSVNYFVVRELSIAMFSLPGNAVIPGGIFFWIATFLIPAIYIWRALYTKEALLLRTGLLLAAVAVFTFRAYFSIAPIEQVMTLAGMILILVSYFVIKYLKKPRRGIIDKAPDENISQYESHVEGLIVSETFKPEAAVEPGFKFGGGSTGGGGASGQF